MQKMEVEKLLPKIKEGDERSFEILTEQYRPLILSVARSFESTAKEEGITGIFPELSQDLTLALYRASKTFDLNQKSVTFGKYAKRCLENCAISSLRKYRSAKRREEKVRTNLKKEQRPITFFPDSAGYDQKSALDSVRSHLSSYEYTVFLKYLEGISVSDIAKDVGQDAKSVSNAVFRCKAKVKRFYKKD